MIHDRNILSVVDFKISFSPTSFQNGSLQITTANQEQITDKLRNTREMTSKGPIQ